MTFTKRKIKNLIKECMRELREGYGGVQSYGSNQNNSWSDRAMMTPEDESKSKWRQFIGDLHTQEGKEFTGRIIEMFRNDPDQLLSLLELAEDYHDYQEKFFMGLKRVQRDA